MEGTIVGMIPSVRGCHPPPRPSLRTIPLLGEMVNLLGTYGASRGKVAPRDVPNLASTAIQEGRGKSVILK